MQKSGKTFMSGSSLLSLLRGMSHSLSPKGVLEPLPVRLILHEVDASVDSTLHVAQLPDVASEALAPVCLTAHRPVDLAFQS